MQKIQYTAWLSGGLWEHVEGELLITEDATVTVVDSKGWIIHEKDNFVNLFQGQLVSE